MDITLMICLLRNIVKLKILDVLPSSFDISEEADLSRIKYYRNNFAHATEGTIDDKTFTNIWKDVSEVGERFVLFNILIIIKLFYFNYIDFVYFHHRKKIF